MANTLQLKNDIKKLKTALASKGLSASIKNKLKGKLEKAEKDLKSAAAPRKTTTTKSQLASLKELVKKKKYSIYKKSGVDLKKDSEEPALPIGRRVSKGLKGNQYGNKKSSKGNVYYEYRANRLDVKQPSKTARYPKLAEGGEVGENGYVAFYKGKKMDVYAKTSLEARDKAAKAFGAKKAYDVTVMLAEKGGKQVTHSASFADGGEVKEPIVVRSYFEEEAYEYAEGGKLSKKDFFKKYEENEDENMHTENVVLLAENYGTESDIRDAKTILAKHESIGHLPTSLRLERDALHDKLWSKYVQSREDGGMMAHGGELTEKAKKAWGKMGIKERMVFLKKQYQDKLENDNLLLKRLESESKKDWDDLAVKIQMEFEKSLGMMADGGRIANDKQKFGLKILKSLKGFNDGQTLNGVLELLGYSQYRFGKYATESQVNEVKNQLDILIKMGYVEESGIGYKITKEGSNFLNMFDYGSYAQGGYMADGDRIANDKQKFGLKILKSLKGFYYGQTLNGILELLGYSKYRFGKYATESQVNEVKNQLDILIKMGYVEESYIGYKITKEGSNFLNMFDYGSYAEGGVTEKEVVDSNAEMVLSNVKEVKHHADELAQIVTKKSNIEAWVVAKIERASTDLSDITHYLEGQHDKMSMGGSVYNHLHKMDKK